MDVMPARTIVVLLQRRLSAGTYNDRGAERRTWPIRFQFTKSHAIFTNTSTTVGFFGTLPAGCGCDDE